MKHLASYDEENVLFLTGKIFSNPLSQHVLEIRSAFESEKFTYEL